MEVAFVRVPELRCEGVVRLDKGRVFTVPAPGAFKQVPPHDVGQFVVEHELGWQTGFWGYIARGIVFPSMSQTEGNRPFHGDERSKAAIREAKELLAETEMLAGAIGNIVHADMDDNAGRITALLASRFGQTHRAAHLPFADIQRACRAFRQAGSDWRALGMGESLRFRWSLRRNPLAPENPLESAAAAKRGRRGRSEHQR